MYVVVVFFEIRAERLESFSRALLHNARRTFDQEPGCKTFDVSIDPADGACFLAYEIYDDEAAFTSHIESQEFKEFSAQVSDWIIHKHVLSYELLSGPGQT